MTTPTQRPWAILLCRFKDDANEPGQTTLSTLHSQWVAKYGSTWVDNNLSPDAAADPRTILNLYQMFFTNAGTGTYNSVRFWDEMSHGSIDVSGSHVFACKLDMTIAEGAALAQTPGGAQYQDAIFKKAKAALASQYGVNWKTFYAVAVSFQSPDYGAQGGQYDGGPGVYMDIRFLRNQGMAAWGQEMGHAFGLDHSRQDGSNDDYQDMWDAMSTLNAFCNTPDPNYGTRGIGLNAWNMRGRHWLDESRIWKGQGQNAFSATVTLRPLHRRDLAGYLGAELPGIGSDSNYLVEFRVPADWDSNIPKATVMIHRFEGPIGQFLGTHSYLEKGTKGQVALSVGDVFEVGNGPYVSADVQSIDAGTNTAVVGLCYSTAPKTKPSVEIRLVHQDSSCPLPPVEGSDVKVVLHLTNALCLQNYTILWSVTGAMPAVGETHTGPSFTIVAPDPSVLVKITLTIVFDDGTTLTTVYAFHPISAAEGSWRLFLCKLRDERLKPIPWWQWDPEKLQKIVRGFSEMEIKLMAERAEQVVQTLMRVVDEGRLGGHG